MSLLIIINSLSFEVACVCTEVQNNSSISICWLLVKCGFELPCGYTKVQSSLRVYSEVKCRGEGQAEGDYGERDGFPAQWHRLWHRDDQG